MNTGSFAAKIAVAGIALAPVGTKCSFCDRESRLRTGSNTGSTDAAFAAVKKKLSLERLAFWIVAPDTAQWTAFKKDGGSNSLPIVDRVALNIDKSWNFHRAPAIMKNIAI